MVLRNLALVMRGQIADTADMAEKLTDALVRSDARGPDPGRPWKISYDSEVTGFGVRVTKNGARSFILNYRARGIERRYTIGSYPDWKVTAAREEAKRLKREIDQGRDPMGERHEERAAPTVKNLIERYLSEHAIRKRERSQREDKSLIERWIKPEIGNRKVLDIRHVDIERLHRKITVYGTPVRANRVTALLSKMFSLAMRWEMRSDNPVRGLERNPEEKRARYLSGDELRRLTVTLAEHPHQQAANAIRLLLLTGSRRGEVLGARWEQFDLVVGVWTKPSAHTKQKREHRVPLSAPALQLLVEIRSSSKSGWLFPSHISDGPLTDIKKSWASICKAAGISGVRLHDLRHTYASVLASAGMSLPVIGALLGHTQPNTTARYAHLFDDPLRAATERAAAIVTGKSTAEIIEISRKA
jgi:integrase